MFATKLKSQLLLITILPLLLTIAVIALFILFDVLDSIENEVVKRGESIAGQASVMSEFPLYTGDVDALKNVAELMMKTHDLAYIRFIDTSGQLLIQQKSSKKSGHLREFSFPVYSQSPNLDDFSSDHQQQAEKVALGTIHIGFTDNSAEAQRFHAYVKVLSISLLALLLGIFLVYLFSRKLSDAIGSMVSTAEKLESRDFTVRVEENGQGELLNLQHTFNSMADALQKNDSELQQKINEATASLNYTVDQLSEKNLALAQQRQETIDLERSKAILEERERIMRDMHDGIGGQLVASLAMLEREQDSEIKNNIHTVLTECLNDLRLIIHSLSMQNNVMGSLLADFKYRTSRKLEQLDIDLDWQVAGEADELAIKPQTGLHLLRILQEAFTNILKHSGANQIRFEASVEQSLFCIEIEDNGQFTPLDETDHTGHGIRNMKSRAAKLDGSLLIERMNAGGCRIVLNFPI
jgi:signal transduction histidine kinase